MILKGLGLGTRIPLQMIIQAMKTKMELERQYLEGKKILTVLEMPSPCLNEWMMMDVAH